MTFEEWLDLKEELDQAWSNFLSSVTDTASKIQALWDDFRKLLYTKPSIPPKEYGTQKKKNHLFRNQTAKIYHADRKIQKHQPYCRRAF